MASKKYTVDQVEETIKISRSWKEVLEKIGLKNAGGNARTIKTIAIKNNIDISHFLGQGWNLGGRSSNEKSIEDSFIKDSKMSKGGIKKKILKFNLIKYECSKCGLSDVWQNQNIILHMDHINGDSKDNRIENLRFLCPNCHSQTKTYCRNNSLENVKEKSKCNNCGRSILNNKTGFCRSCWGKQKVNLSDIGINKNQLQEKVKLQNMKSVCSEIKVGLDVLRRICREENIIVPNFRGSSEESKCLAMERSRKFHVDKEKLEDMLKTKSILQIGKEFGVSDNAVRKRCNIMGIDWKNISKFSHNKNAGMA